MAADSDEQFSQPAMRARLATIAMWRGALLPGQGWSGLAVMTAVGWSRVALGIHYVGDVLAGVALHSVWWCFFGGWG